MKEFPSYMTAVNEYCMPGVKAMLPDEGFRRRVKDVEEEGSGEGEDMPNVKVVLKPSGWPIQVGRERGIVPRVATASVPEQFIDEASNVTEAESRVDAEVIALPLVKVVPAWTVVSVVYWFWTKFWI